MAEELHASLTPNVVQAGEELELAFDSEDEWKDAESVFVRIFEVDDASPFEPKPGKDRVLVVFHGKLVDNAFTLTPPPGGAANPEVTAVSGTPPVVRIRAGGVTTEVPLPDKAKEHGVFELRLQVDVRAPKPRKFTSAATVLVRSYDSLLGKQMKRPVVAFIAGGRDDSYVQAAASFWRQNADAVVSRPGLSLQEILEVLAKEHASYGDWAQVNIIAHGRERSIEIRLFTDSSVGLHTDEVEEQIGKHAKLAPPVSLPAPAGLTADTQIVMRACNAGRDADLLKKLHDRVFGGCGKLFVPKFVQVYQAGAGSTTANEWFEESLTFDTPTLVAPTGTELQAHLEAAWDALESPGKGGDRAVEIATFTEVKDWVQTYLYTVEAEPEFHRTNPDGSPMSEAELVARFRGEWQTRHKRADESATWNTESGRWDITLKSQAATKESGVTRGYFMRVRSGVASPMFKEQAGGAISVGGVKANNVWVVTAADVGDLHFDVDFDSGPDRVRVTDANCGAATWVGKQKLEPEEDRVFALPITITFGAAALEVRQARMPVDLEFECKRYHVDRRRTLRKFEDDKAHADRSLVTPTVDDAGHYGNSP